MSDYTELKLLVDRVLKDRRFCGDENHLTLATGVSVLIAENERLTACREALTKERAAQMRQRDQLRAEVAGLRTGYEAYEQVNAELKAEVEGLRRERDARHPFKPFHEPAIGFTGCVICGAYTDHGGLPCPKTRAAANALAMENQRITPVEPLRVPHPLDAALGQGEQS